MVDIPPRGDCSSKPENHPHEPGVELFHLKQEQAKDFPHLPQEHLTPITTGFDQRAGQDMAVTNEENTYQPLIPPRLMALGDDKSEYQSLTQKILPNVPLGSTPPTIPRKPKATSAITRGSVQQVKKQ